MPKAALFLDFDDCVNFFGSRTSYRRNKDTFGYIARVDIFADGYFYPVNWSKELVNKFNDAKDKYGFSWLWLTTWKEHAVNHVDRVLGTRSDGYIEWDTSEKFGSANKNLRDISKYAVLLDTLRANPTPFIWIDDSATAEYNKDDFVGVLDVPHVIIRPLEGHGILKTDFKRMIDFLDSLDHNDA